MDARNHGNKTSNSPAQKRNQRLAIRELEQSQDDDERNPQSNEDIRRPNFLRQLNNVVDDSNFNLPICRQEAEDD